MPNDPPFHIPAAATPNDGAESPPALSHICLPIGTSAAAPAASAVKLQAGEAGAAAVLPGSGCSSTSSSISQKNSKRREVLLAPPRPQPIRAKQQQPWAKAKAKEAPKIGCSVGPAVVMIMVVLYLLMLLGVVMIVRQQVLRRAAAPYSLLAGLKSGHVGQHVVRLQRLIDSGDVDHLGPGGAASTLLVTDGGGTKSALVMLLHDREGRTDATRGVVAAAAAAAASRIRTFAAADDDVDTSADLNSVATVPDAVWNNGSIAGSAKTSNLHPVKVNFDSEDADGKPDLLDVVAHSDADVERKAAQAAAAIGSWSTLKIAAAAAAPEPAVAVTVAAEEKASEQRPHRGTAGNGRNGTAAAVDLSRAVAGTDAGDLVITSTSAKDGMSASDTAAAAEPRPTIWNWRAWWRSHRFLGLESRWR